MFCKLDVGFKLKCKGESSKLYLTCIRNGNAMKQLE